MKKELMSKISFDDYLGCFGNFNIDDQVCKKLCALRLRCAVDHDKNTRMELLEDLISNSGMFNKIH